MYKCKCCIIEKMLYNNYMKNNKLILITALVLFLVLCAFEMNKYHVSQTNLNEHNICQDDELIARLIDQNANPFSKFKFIKKRNTDCKVLLITNKEEALEKQNIDFCSFLDASTNSVSLLILTYVNDMYDRETASKEYKTMIPLMTPYNYCPQYLDNMYTLIKIKKKLGL